MGQMRGRYRLVKSRNGEVTQDTGWFNNLLLDAGLNVGVATADRPWNYCSVGTGNTAPNVTQTSLVARVATTGQAGSGEAWGPPPTYARIKTIRYRFGTGTAAGNLSEVGVGWANNGSALFSRALIIDEVGNPTTVTVLADEILDVYFAVELYLPLTDSSTQIEIDNVLRDVVIRAANLGGSWSSRDFGTFGASDAPAVYICTGTLAPITGSPSGGLSTDSGGTAVLPYNNNSLVRDYRSTWSVVRGSGTYNSLCIQTYVGHFQMSVSPPIVKTNSQQLQLTFRLGFSRYVP